MNARIISLLILLFVMLQIADAQLMFDVDHPTEASVLKTSTGLIHGTLTIPSGKSKKALVLIIAGSGPTDRDGNNPRMKNNSLKQLSKFLADMGVASLRFDKRGIAASKAALIKEADIRFEHYIEDAKGWIDFLRTDERFSEVIVLGHSEGSLIGMIAAQKRNADAFISVAGVGRSADLVIIDQLEAQAPAMKEMALPIINSLKKGEMVENVNPMFSALFRPSVQPYMISWFKYDPCVEIIKLKVPVLILQGTTDIQVSVNDASLLHEAAPKASLKIIDGMNHVLKIAPENRSLNIQTYNQPKLPLHSQLCQEIGSFIQTL